MENKVLIAMSGGVDSSVAAALLNFKGYECAGATMKLYSNEDICMDLQKEALQPGLISHFMYLISKRISAKR